MFDSYHGDESQAGPSTSRYRPSAGDRRFNLDTAQDAMAQTGEHSNVRATGIARGDTVDIQENKWTDPVTYEDGVFQGRIVRFLLRCVQEPVSGRRKTEKDRRPLAPVPIIRIWVKECLQDEAGIWTEEDLDTSDVDPSCLICEVQLTAPLTDRAAGGVIESLPTQGPMEGDQVPLLDPSFHIPHPHPSDFARPPLMAYQSFTSTSQVPLNPRQLIQNEQLRYHPPSPQHRASWVADGHWDTHSSAHTGGPENRPVQHSYKLSGELAPAPATGRSRKMTETDLGSSDDDMSGVGRKKLRRGESRNLYGALHVSGVKVVAPSGEQGFWFLFTDLCVRHEGTYALQFRVFDLSLTQADKPPVPHLADCESGTFKVYSPRSFPGMPKPTELSEHFIRQGYKLNTRKNEKIARSLSPTSPERPSEMNASPSRQVSRTTSSTSTNLPA